MKRLHLAFEVLAVTAILTLACSSSASAEPRSFSEQTEKRLNSLFYRWQGHELDLAKLHRRARVSGRIQLSVGDRSFDLQLEPNDLRAPGFRQILRGAKGASEQKGTQVATFKGHIVGDPDSVVRLLILPDLIQGYIRTKDEWYFIDPLFKFVKGAPPAQVVAYEEDDVRPDGRQLCGAGELDHMISGLEASKEPSIKTQAITSGTRILYLATDADYEYYSIYGANTNSQIQGVINQVDGIFQNSLGIAVWISYQNVWTSIYDPYTASSSWGLLQEFQNYWKAYYSSVYRNAAHLFTGKTPTDAQGIAWMSVVCSYPTYSYGVSYEYYQMAKLVSHEIGHSLAANHDDQVSPQADPCYGNGPIMCSYLQNSGPDIFSSRSASDIWGHVYQYGSCLGTYYEPDPDPDPCPWWDQYCQPAY